MYNKINKKKIDKIMAKIAWFIMQIITAISFIFILVAIGIMIEALKVNTALFIICFCCLVWIVLFFAFINHANGEK